MKLRIIGTYKKKLTFENKVPFRSCISKINNSFVENTEVLRIVMPIYDLLESSSNYFMTSGSLWRYYRDEVNNSANEIDGNDNKINNKKATRNSSEYKTKILGRMPNYSKILDAEVVVPVKYLRCMKKIV